MTIDQHTECGTRSTIWPAHKSEIGTRVCRASHRWSDLYFLYLRLCLLYLYCICIVCEIGTSVCASHRWLGKWSGSHSTDQKMLQNVKLPDKYDIYYADNSDQQMVGVAFHWSEDVAKFYQILNYLMNMIFITLITVIRDAAILRVLLSLSFVICQSGQAKIWLEWHSVDE